MRVEDLNVYKKLFKLAYEVNELTMTFPKHEMYELGSQLRRSSNSSPANVAEGFGNKHTNIYLESISRSQGEIRETKILKLIKRKILVPIFNRAHYGRLRPVLKAIQNHPRLELKIIVGVPAAYGYFFKN